MAKRSALQRHADYFDPEGTGTIRLEQTYRGLRDLGVSRPWSVALASIINGALGPVTQRRATLTIDIDQIARGKHASDTGIFDADGEFVPSRFDELFEASSTGEIDAISRKELRSFMHADGPQSLAGDFFSAAEAKLFFCVAADATKTEDGERVPAITRQRLRSFYLGNLLPALRRWRRIKSI